MLIGLGGGAASSMAAGSSHEDLDFASVQRGNPEIQRRAQEVIDRCAALGEANPILSVHDVGAGGLSNAVPEIVHGAGRGGSFELREVPNDDPGMSPMQIWCNEAQERYVLAIAAEGLEGFKALCERERCPYAVIGVATEQPVCGSTDRQFANRAGGFADGRAVWQAAEDAARGRAMADGRAALRF
jgi:phosphoribosylformylglycinamidine synthase